MTVETVSVHILGKDYQVACPDEERDSLIRAAAELDHRMKTIRQSGTVIGVERIAVMAALNLAHELNSAAASYSEKDNDLIDDMCERVDALLSR